MLAAEPVARRDLVLQGVHLPLVGDMACVAPVVVGEAIHVADHVRRHARAFDREAVTASVARDPSSPAGAECVAEDPVGLCVTKEFSRRQPGPYLERSVST